MPTALVDDPSDERDLTVLGDERRRSEHRSEALPGIVVVEFDERLEIDLQVLLTDAARASVDAERGAGQKEPPVGVSLVRVERQLETSCWWVDRLVDAFVGVDETG